MICHLSHFQLGDIATWIGSIGTTGAFGVSLYLLGQTIKDRRATQAKQVACWQDGPIVPAEIPFSPEVDYSAIIKYTVRNSSQEPVYDVRLAAPCDLLGTFVKDCGVIGPLDEKEVRFWLPAGQANKLYRADYSPRLTFVDTAGKQWYRDGNGKLSNIQSKQVAELIKEDPGVFESIDEHPTLHMQ